METYTIKEAIEKGLLIIQKDNDMSYFWLVSKEEQNIILGFESIPTDDQTKISFNENNEVTAIFF